MAEQVYGNVTIKGFVIGPVVVNDYVLGVIKNADNDYTLQIKRGGEEQMIPVVSPMLTTEAIEGGTRVTIEDISGTRSFDILNGKDGIDGKDGQDGANGKDGIDGKDGANGIDGQDGKDGKDGKDGVSPVVAVTEIENGHRVTITDAEGEKTFDVPNGGSGLPSGGAPYQQLVTDGEGKTVWEDRLGGYYEDPETQTLVDDATVSGTGAAPFAVDLTEGKEYRVTYDGVTYDCTAYAKTVQGLTGVFIGNAGIAGMAGGNSEPFFYGSMAGQYLFGNSDQATHVVSISTFDRKAVPLDSIFLPTASAEAKGAVYYGEGYSGCARTINTYFSATFEEVARAYEAYMREGVMWRIAGDLVTHATGNLDSGGLFLTLWRGQTAENGVSIKSDGNGGVTMERYREYPDRLYMQGGGKMYEITVNASGTLTATEV